MPEISEPHKTSHQNGGEDEISVAGLSGELADDQPPKAHASDHYDGGADPIDASQLDKMLKIVPYNAKIADIKEADTAKHTLNLSVALGETRKIIMLNVFAYRESGTGTFDVYPNEGAIAVNILWAMAMAPIVIKDGSQRLQYNQGVANDDFDLYCFGYVVEA